jgi:hypothetical protein
LWCWLLLRASCGQQTTEFLFYTSRRLDGHPNIAVTTLEALHAALPCIQGQELWIEYLLSADPYLPLLFEIDDAANGHAWLNDHLRRLNILRLGFDINRGKCRGALKSLALALFLVVSAP